MFTVHDFFKPWSWSEEDTPVDRQPGPENTGRQIQNDTELDGTPPNDIRLCSIYRTAPDDTYGIDIISKPRERIHVLTIVTDNDNASSSENFIYLLMSSFLRTKTTSIIMFFLFIIIDSYMTTSRAYSRLIVGSIHRKLMLADVNFRSWSRFKKVMNSEHMLTLVSY